MKYIDALKLALTEVFEEMPNAVAIGQDIRLWGGASGLFMGLHEKYSERVIDTPISEIGTTGIAVGMAMNGFRPIIENTFIDFILHAMDPIVNQAAKIKDMSAGQFSAPIISRGVISSQRGYGATHSQSLENLFFDVSGLSVVFPSNATDAYALLKASFRHDKPVVFVEHKLLHEKEFPFEKTTVEIGKANILSEGNNVTLVTWGRMVGVAEEAVKNMPGIELIDLRSLAPLDYETIIASVQKTGKLLLLEEGYGTISAEVAATVAEKAFSSLNKPIMRIHAERRVIPFLKEQEDATFPSVEKVSTAVASLLS